MRRLFGTPEEPTRLALVVGCIAIVAFVLLASWSGT